MNGGPFVTLTPGKRSPDLARQIEARYSRTTPALMKKKLTRHVLGMDEAIFARLDADGDGILDLEELARFGQRPPDLEFLVRLGKRGKDQARIELMPARKGNALAAKTRKTGEGTVLDLGVTRLVFRSTPESNARFVVAIEQQYRAQFKAADRDNNGYVDRNEAARSPFFRRIFKAMDRDNDGKLFEKEMLAYLERMRGLQEAAQKSCASLSVQDQGRGIFDLVDSNRDGRLGVRELRNMVGLVKQLDRDGDGCISRTEIPRSYQMDVRKGPSGGGGGYGQVVFINGMVQQRPLPNPTAGPVWFRKMDRNRDGDVSRREFLGTNAEFRRIDADGDGLISVEEADRADQRLRKEKGRK
jgi:Ca2+-binding EF-hand superfamily protein